MPWPARHYSWMRVGERDCHDKQAKEDDHLPIVNFHLVEGQQTDQSIKALLLESGELYLDTLYTDQNPRPFERLRTFASIVKPEHWATAGKMMDEGGANAPYFTFLVLKGRPPEQIERLLTGFTDLLVKHTRCKKMCVRGLAIPIEPELWGIGGQSAAKLRRSEIDARANISQ